MEALEKVSVVPFSFGGFGKNNVELPLALEEIQIESIEGLLKAEHFTVWRDYFPSSVPEPFEQAKVALVHRFASGYVTGKDEEHSKDLLHKAFLCLRVIKPTRTRFSLVQYRKMKNNDLDVFSVVWPAMAIRPNLPESEVLNSINVSDLHELKGLWPSFRKMRDSGPQNLRRATRYYETGYDALQDADLQFTTWLMGIEALFAEGDEPCSSEQIKNRIVESIGPDTDIYREFEERDLYAREPVLVKDILDKMFELRDRFVHGAWAPRSWFDNPVRKAIAGGSLTLPDVLREAASFILRTGIKKELGTTNGG